MCDEGRESQSRIGGWIVCRPLASLHETKSSRIEWHMRVLKKSADVILAPLSIVFENSWRTSEISESWWWANVPVYKERKKGSTVYFDFTKDFDMVPYDILEVQVGKMRLDSCYC